MVEKVDVELSRCRGFLYPRNTVLVTCVGKDGKPNIITCEDSMPTSYQPPMVAVCISSKRYSYRLIIESGEFVINIPTIDIVKEVLTCGRTSGQDIDKFKMARLTPIPAQLVRAPLIKECIAHLECKLSQQLETGDHTIFVGNVIKASADQGVFTEVFDLKKVKPVLHIGGDTFTTTTKTIVPKI
ncbi:MAG: hypothetical protein QG670_1872 [Thermoproteota archaeon]|nr:hypothetical protein [Thermoproteota archaeon]